MDKMKRVLSSVLILAMLVCCIPMQVLGAEADAALPTATVASISNDRLTFAANFKVDAPAGNQLEEYGSWYADYELTVNKDVTFNANGGADGYLSAQSDKWGEPWLCAPSENLALKANKPLKIAGKLSNSGAQYTFADICEQVSDFDCGVYFEPAFLAANPDLEVTLQLKMYDPANESVGYAIGESYIFRNGFEACNKTTGKLYAKLTTAMAEAVSGQTVLLLKDVTESAMISVLAGTVLDLNGKVLKVDRLISYGNVIDGSEANTGTLKAPVDQIYIRQDNTQLPVGTAEGYRFVKINKFNEIIMNLGKYAFDFRPETAAHALLLPGVDTTGVKLQVEATWEQENGTRSQLLEYKDSHVTEFINSYDTATGWYGRMFTLTLNGAEKLNGLTFRARLLSDTMVYVASSGKWLGTSQGAESDVTTDEDNKVSEEVTVTVGTATATVAAGTKLEEDTTSLSLTITEKQDGDQDIEVGAGEQTNSMDVHMEGVAADNTVPIIVTLDAFAPKYMNVGNLTLYHVEKGTPVEMTRVFTVGEVDAHNEYYYDIATGTVTMALASFSEVTAVSSVENIWNGEVHKDLAGAGTKEDPYLIYNADQLAGMSQLVSDNADYAKAHYKLQSNVNFGGEENTTSARVFYPIGYWKLQEGKDYYGRGNTFTGTFDGNGNTIKNIYQNTWTMHGDYDKGYWNDAMGLFGAVFNTTIKNLTMYGFESDGEFTPTGCVAAFAGGNSTFENITLVNCNPRVYNTGNGGIVGLNYNSTAGTPDHLRFENITIDQTNKISALWGSYDVSCGGILGRVRDNSQHKNGEYNTVHFENCHVAAILDVNNDVCANYQYYQYRYCGMMIGTVDYIGEVPNVGLEDVVTAKKCTVTYGDWNEYWYCELVANTLASYTHDHQFSRLVQVAAVDVENKTYTPIGGEVTDIPTSGRYNYVVVTGNPKETTAEAKCYHFVNGEKWEHKDAGFESFDNTMYKEDRYCYYLPFGQLFTGYGWGSSPVYNAANYPNIDIRITDENSNLKATEKFNVIHNYGYYKSDEAVTLGDLVELAVDETKLSKSTLQVFVSPMEENKTITSVVNMNTNDWASSTLTITGDCPVKVTLTDYFYCLNTELIMLPLDRTTGMYERVNADTTVIEDSIKGNQEYVIVAQKNGKYYALDDAGKATLVHVVGDYVTDIGTTAEWTLGTNGDITFCDTATGKYLSYNESTTKLEAATSYGWLLEATADTETTKIFTLSVIDEDDVDQKIAYHDGAFGVYDSQEHGADSDYIFNLRLYKRICLHEKADGTSAVVPVDAVAPTCSTVGYTAGTQCTLDKCMEYQSGHEEVKGQHEYEDGSDVCIHNCGVRKVKINGTWYELFPWNDPTSLPSSGNYYLNCDVTVDKNTNVSKNLILDLFGNTITRTITADSTGAGRVYTVVNRNADLVIADTATPADGVIKLEFEDAAAEQAYAALTDKRGTLINVGRGELVLAGGTLDGSNIQGNDFGHATVFINSGEKFTMTGGEVIGGKNTGNGSAVYICREATATITDGAIYGGTAATGAAIFAGGDVTVGGTAKVYSGTATSTRDGVTRGDSIYAGSYTVLSDKTIGSKLTITGTATINGGICVDSGLGFTISGNPTIDKTQGNDRNNYKSNYSIVTPMDCDTDATKGVAMKLDVSTMTNSIPVNAYSAFTTVFATKTAAETAMAKVTIDTYPHTDHTDVGTRQVFVKKIADDKYVLAAGINCCVDGCVGTVGEKCTTHGNTIDLYEYWGCTTMLPSAGKYTLVTDVTLSETMYMSGDLTLNLNGHTVTAPSSSFAIHGQSYHLTINDTSGKYGDALGKITTQADVKPHNNEAGLVASRTGDITINNGIIDGSKEIRNNGATTKEEQGVAVGTVTTKTGTITVNGGIVKGMRVGNNLPEANSGNAGSCLAVTGPSGSVVINGGQLIAPDPTDAIPYITGGGGCIYSRGPVTITGGELIGNKVAAHGGCVWVDNNSFTMTGGVLRDGSATRSGLLNCGGKSSITGGVLVGGSASDLSEFGGHNIDFNGTELTIGGDAIIGGGVGIRENSKLILTGKPVIHSGMQGEATDKGDIRLYAKGTAAAKVYLDNTSGDPIVTADAPAEGATIAITVKDLEYTGSAITGVRDFAPTGPVTAAQFVTYKSGGLKMTEDVTLTSAIEMNGNLTIDLNGHKLTRQIAETETTAQYAINTNGYRLIIIDTSDAGTGTITATGSVQSEAGLIYVPTGSLIVNSGTIDGSNLVRAKGLSGMIGVITTDTGSVTINGGTIKGMFVNADNSGSSSYAGSALAGAAGSTITINGGTLQAPTTTTALPYVAGAGGVIATAGSLNVNGGEIIGGKAGAHGGAIYATGDFTMTGGLIHNGNSNNSGNIALLGAGASSITGGVIIDGHARETGNTLLGGANIDVSGCTLTIGGNAVVGGGVSARNKTTKIVIKDQAVIDMSLQKATQALFNIRLRETSSTGYGLYLGDTVAQTAAKYYKITHAPGGKVNGIIAAN